MLACERATAVRRSTPAHWHVDDPHVVPAGPLAVAAITAAASHLHRAPALMPAAHATPAAADAVAVVNAAATVTNTADAATTTTPPLVPAGSTSRPETQAYVVIAASSSSAATGTVVEPASNVPGLITAGSAGRRGGSGVVDVIREVTRANMRHNMSVLVRFDVVHPSTTTTATSDVAVSVHGVAGEVVTWECARLELHRLHLKGRQVRLATPASLPSVAAATAPATRDAREDVAETTCTTCWGLSLRIILLMLILLVTVTVIVIVTAV